MKNNIMESAITNERNNEEIITKQCNRAVGCMTKYGTSNKKEIFSSSMKDKLLYRIGNLSYSVRSSTSWCQDGSGEDLMNHFCKILMIDMPNMTAISSNETQSIECYEELVNTYSEMFKSLTPLPSEIQKPNEEVIRHNLRYLMKPIHHGVDSMQLLSNIPCHDYGQDEELLESNYYASKYEGVTPVCVANEMLSLPNIPLITKSKTSSDELILGFIENRSVPVDKRKTFRSLLPISSNVVPEKDQSELLLYPKPIPSNSNINNAQCQYYMTKSSRLIKDSNNNLPTNICEIKAAMKNFSASIFTIQRCTRTPIVSSWEVVDWQTMIKNFVWNIQAWRDWIDINFIIGINYVDTEGKSLKTWLKFQYQVTTDIRQWQRYEKFCAALTTKLQGNIVRVKATDTVKTLLNAWLLDLLKIEGICSRWTQWLLRVVNIMKDPNMKDEDFGELRWQHFKAMLKKYKNKWKNYNKLWKVSYEERYTAIISTWLPKWCLEDSVWMSSSVGMVPCGGVSAGICEGEEIWLARVVHQSQLVPAALYPSKQCACVYAEDKVHCYSDYQVLCNAEVSWITWRDNSEVNPVFVAPGVRVGRVKHCDSHYICAIRASDNSCHVNLHGRHLGFQYYEILVIPPL